MSEALCGEDLLSLAGSHPGHVRARNEDAVLAMPDAGMWAVADGMGGHSQGDLASRTIVEALAVLAGRAAAALAPSAMAEELRQVNRQLHARAGASATPCVIGSTVVALLLEGERYHCLWAGDSRAYLWREAVLHRLTEDHSVAVGGALTRAVGAEAELELDYCGGYLYRGDFFLLCSDGLNKSLDDAEIAAVLLEEQPQDSVPALIRAALARGAPDNVSCVAVGVPDGVTTSRQGV